MTLHWPLDELHAGVGAELSGCRIDIMPQVDSTNTQLMQRLHAGESEPALLVAETQTAGRGRQGRTWLSTPGASLTFSLSAPAAEGPLDGLSLAVGCAVADALDPSGQVLRLKWPNDVWLASRAPRAGWSKLAGILIETAACRGVRHVVVGIGINITSPTDAPSTTAVAPGALRDIDARWDVPTALLAVAPRVARVLRDFPRSGFAAWRADFARRDLLDGVPLALSDGTRGMGAGIADNGALLVDTPQGAVAVQSGEVSVRPC